MIGVRLLLKDNEGRDVSVLLISEYAPDISKSEDIWAEYIDQLDICIQRKRKMTFLLLAQR